MLNPTGVSVQITTKTTKPWKLNADASGGQIETKVLGLMARRFLSEIDTRPFCDPGVGVPQKSCISLVLKGIEVFHGPGN